VVSDDAALVAVRQEGGRLALNRPRANAFTLENWQRAMVSETVEKPVSAPGSGGPAVDADASGFVCGEGLCLTRHASGAVVAYAQGPDAAERACASATLLIVDDATVEEPCGDRVATITRRDLARRGAVEIRFRASAPGPAVGVTFAISKPYRPWHAHREFSRAARGLLPYQSKRDQRQSRPPVRSQDG
jgi:competence protein ComEC